MTKQEIIQSFDPNSVSSHPGIFGLPFEKEHAEVVFFPVPWDVTSSYSSGSSLAPEAIKEASYQVDLWDPFVENAWKRGHFMMPLDQQWEKENRLLREKAVQHITQLEKGNNRGLPTAVDEVNQKCAALNQWVLEETTSLLKEGKKVILLGGDHSTPFGYMKALSSIHASFGILQIDAHADLRIAYEGFTYSHASIFYNALREIKSIEKLVQVGIRDYCQEELEQIEGDDRVETFFDRDLKHQQFKGVSWHDQVSKIVHQLPEKVYISFDIDGLDPSLCPNTGTPVPGGMSYEEVIYLFEQIKISGRTIIGADLNEVAPGEGHWDANVGARILWRMSNLL